MAKKIVFAFIVFALLSLVIVLITKGKSLDYLEVVFLDIGQGDATLINFGNGQKMLIDCAIDARVVEALGRHMSFFDRYIDYMVVTHTDLDHYGGCQEVLERFEVGEVVLNGDSKSDDTWESFIGAIHKEVDRPTIISEQMKWMIGSTTFHYMFPDEYTSEETKGNERSIVILLSSGEVDVLLAADAEVSTERYLINKYKEELGSEIFKAGHHGSVGSSSEELLSMVKPQDTIISCGADNSFGHPSQRIIKRLERAGSRIWRTDENGDILLNIYGDENRYEIYY